MLVVVIVLGSLMAVVYLWRIVESAWFGVAAADPEQNTGGEAPLSMLALTWLAALANIWFGLASSIPRGLATDAATTLLRHLP